MDVEQTQTASKSADPGVLSQNAGDRKELAWAFLGLVLWSIVVLGGLFGVGYLVGHSMLHWW
jgi:hypothetical protein